MRHEHKCHFDHMMPLEGAGPVGETAAPTGQIGGRWAGGKLSKVIR